MAMPEQITLAAIFYLEQVFVFCRLINQNASKMFPLIMGKEHNLSRSTNFLSRKHPTSCFRLRREGRYMPNTQSLWLDVLNQFLHSCFLNLRKSLKFYRTATSESIPKKTEHLLFTNTNLVFLLAAWVN